MTAPAGSLPFLDLPFLDLPFLDHGSDAFARDPHACLRTARAESPIVRTPTGVGLLTYAACNALLVDPDFRPGVFEMIRRTLLGSEGTDHQELRRVVMPWFAPRRIETLRAQTAALVDELVAGVAGDGGCEFMADVANRIPPTVFCWMVGCDVQRGPELAHWSSRSGRRATTSRAPCSERSRRGVLTRRDVRSLLTELLSASVDNTTHSMGLAVWLLCEHPAEWSSVADGVAPVERAVEECARYEPVIRHGNHVADPGHELLGIAVAPGTLVTVYLASAHRDPEVYDDPDRFDAGRRSPQPHLEFGIGRHYCVGAALARLEIQEVVRGVTTRWRTPQIRAGARVRTATTGEVDALPMQYEVVAVR